MKRLGGLVAGAVKELWGLLVDDGFLAVAALVAIAVTYLLSRSAALGPVDVVGWALVGMLAVATFVSVRRAWAAHRR